ncbi:OLC1v1019564C4 [Oldenlandia corymbosa var. corymbosa]|uniref:OLC1v1019564C4 n=1 Tax=Oldenlandia corymbosa var. corymbosa TaxID=529605 RepID=A0AAV1EES7_OLDCO|nr:OLC1v1019564C4 [Oldenlandia corymbosa var. corymbosa]
MKDGNNLAKDQPEEEDSLPSVSSNIDFVEENSLSRDILLNKEHNPIVLLKILNSNNGNKQWYFQEIYGLDNYIPKHIMGFDEKYLRRCLEWMHISAYGTAPCNFSSKLAIAGNYLGSRGYNTRSTDDMVSPFIECSCVPVADSAAINPVGADILGAISASKSMINILRSPLLQRFGALESTAIGGGGQFEEKEAISTDLFISPSNFVSNKSGKLKEMVHGDYECGSEPVHKRLSSISSTNSTCSDHSSSSGYAAVSQGMLQCTWKDGYPHYLFSVDDQGEVYAANLFNVRSPDDKVLDYVYSFHLKSGGKSKHENQDIESDLVGTMKVSTSVTLCPKNSEIFERQFVLFGSNDSWAKEQNSLHSIKKHKGLAKKVTDVFRPTLSHKQRRYSKNLGTSVILEDTSWESSDDVCGIPDHCSVNILDAETPPNLELAAIVVKDHVCGKPKDSEIGGWGMKFLKKPGIKNETPSEDSVVSECCKRDNGQCSASMNIILPAGYHGGPKTRKGGPSTLLERWRSSGQCDCGGWDIGCPLTVLNTLTNRMEHLPLTDSGECKTVDIFIEVCEVPSDFLDCFLFLLSTCKNFVSTTV